MSAALHGYVAIAEPATVSALPYLVLQYDFVWHVPWFRWQPMQGTLSYAPQ